MSSGPLNRKYSIKSKEPIPENGLARSISPFEDKCPLNIFAFDGGEFTWFASREEGSILRISFENGMDFLVRLPSSELSVKSVSIKVLIHYVKNLPRDEFSIRHSFHFKSTPEMSILFSNDFDTSILKIGENELKFNKRKTQGIWDWLSDISCSSEKVNLFQ